MQAAVTACSSGVAHHALCVGDACEGKSPRPPHISARDDDGGCAPVVGNRHAGPGTGRGENTHSVMEAIHT